MKYRAVLIDIDDTLFDFRQSSFEALVKTFSAMGLSFTWEDMPVYEQFNNRMWQAFERGDIQKEEIYVTRFRDYFAFVGLDADPVFANDFYLKRLAEGRAFKPNAEALLQALHGRVKVFVVTNGDTVTQQKRIEASGFAPYFDAVFISEQMGTKKPEKAFFDQVFSTVGEEYRSSCLLLGDSLTSDMQGGRNAGIPTCFYGKKEAADDRCDFVIEDLLDFLPLLED